MPTVKGPVHSVYLDNNTMWLIVLGEKPVVPLTIFADAPGTSTIPQLELARRSWMLAMVQNCYVHKLDIEVTFGTDNVVTALKLPTTLKVTEPHNFPIPVR